MMKKLWNFLSSMRFALVLLVILAAACAVGSVIPQGKALEWYVQHYSERTAALIVGIRLDDVFHSWWFLTITIFLCFNLLLCNVLRLPPLIRRFQAAKLPDAAIRGPVTGSVEQVSDPERIFAALRMPKPASHTIEDQEVLFSSKNRVGLWGAWVCHLGILLLLAGFTLGQMTHQEYTVYGVPGQTKLIGETNYALGIHDFQVERRENDSVEQYVANVTVYDLTDPDNVLSETATVSVNHPASCFGFKLYQNSMGWAARVTVKKDDAIRQDDFCCLGDSVCLLDTPVCLSLQSYLPDYKIEKDGTTRDAYVYAMYVNGELYTEGLQLSGDTIPYFTPYEVSFSEPQYYTLIQVKKDSFTALALAGGLITMLGLFLAFYLQPKKVWAKKEAYGTWTVCGHCPKGGALFLEQLKSAAQDAALH